MKDKKWIIIAVLAVAVIALAVLLIKPDGGSGGKDGSVPSPEDISVEDIEIDASAAGLTVVSMDSIAGMYVEDGTDEVLDGIFTVTFRNDADVTLQYAKLLLTVGEECYSFEISTLPAGETLRAMEMNRKSLVSSKGEVTLTEENIAWFTEEPSMYENALKITPTPNGIVVENISDETLGAPIYVYYKNYVDGVYVGGITYRAGTQNNLAPGETAALSAQHFDPDNSRLMFVTYAA